MQFYRKNQLISHIQFYHLLFLLSGWPILWKKDDDWLLEREKHDIKVGKARVGKDLTVAAPINNQSRRSETSQTFNPILYCANYFGHKIHFYQNKKLVTHGLVQVASIEGHRQYIVGTCMMPVKNNRCIQLIYPISKF